MKIKVVLIRDDITEIVGNTAPDVSQQNAALPMHDS